MPTMLGTCSYRRRIEIPIRACNTVGALTGRHDSNPAGPHDRRPPTIRWLVAVGLTAFIALATAAIGHSLPKPLASAPPLSVARPSAAGPFHGRHAVLGSARRPGHRPAAAAARRPRWRAR